MHPEQVQWLWACPRGWPWPCYPAPVPSGCCWLTVPLSQPLVPSACLPSCNTSLACLLTRAVPVSFLPPSPRLACLLWALCPLGCAEWSRSSGPVAAPVPVAMGTGVTPLCFAPLPPPSLVSGSPFLICSIQTVLPCSLVSLLSCSMCLPGLAGSGEVSPSCTLPGCPWSGVKVGILLPLTATSGCLPS